MTLTTVAVMSPGDMGEGIGTSLLGQGLNVITTLEGRSDETAMRANRAGFRSLGTIAAVLSEADLVLSVMPPGQAEKFATVVATAMTETGHRPAYADMNAVSPATSRNIARVIREAGADYIDGGIIGAPPLKSPQPARLYVSGPSAGMMDALDGNGIIIHQLGGEIGRASAVKMVYASVSKGTDTLLTAAYTTAEVLGIRDVLEAEWADSQPAVLERLSRRVPALPADAGRWIGEMEEIAATYKAAGVTPDFHKGAADMYRLLHSTPFAAETRETMDRSRSMQDSVRVYAAHLPDRETAE